MAVDAAAPGGELSAETSEIWDRLADVGLPGGELACISGSPISDCCTWPNFPQSSALESKQMVLVASPPIMVARTVTFSPPCFLTRSHVFLSCFCTSSQAAPWLG